MPPSGLGHPLGRGRIGVLQDQRELPVVRERARHVPDTGLHSGCVQPPPPGWTWRDSAASRPQAGPCAIAQSAPSAEASRVINSVPPRRLLASPWIEHRNMTGSPACAKGGKVAVATTAATFRMQAIFCSSRCRPKARIRFVRSCCVSTPPRRVARAVLDPGQVPHMVITVAGQRGRAAARPRGDDKGSVSASRNHPVQPVIAVAHGIAVRPIMSTPTPILLGTMPTKLFTSL